MVLLSVLFLDRDGLFKILVKRFEPRIERVAKVLDLGKGRHDPDLARTTGRIMAGPPPFVGDFQRFPMRFPGRFVLDGLVEKSGKTVGHFDGDPFRQQECLKIAFDRLKEVIYRKNFSPSFSIKNRAASEKFRASLSQNSILQNLSLGVMTFPFP